MRRLVSVALAVAFLLMSSLPGIPAGSRPEASAVQAQIPFAPPTPGSLSPEVELARARAAIEAVLQKYIENLGPEYQLAPVQVAVDGEWALGMAEWIGEPQGFAGPMHVLAHRLPQGYWQALTPSTEGLYLRWVEALPVSLVTSGEKSQMRAQATEASSPKPRVQPVQTGVSATPSPGGGKETYVVLFSDSDAVFSLEPGEGTQRLVGKELLVSPSLLASTTHDIYNPANWLPDFAPTEGYLFYHGLVSPAGDQVAYVEAKCDDSRCIADYKVWLVSLRSHTRQSLFDSRTGPSGLLLDPVAWSATTGKLVFDSLHPGSDGPYHGLWVYNLANQSLSPVDLGPGAYNSRVWLSPDQRHLLFAGSTELDKQPRPPVLGTPTNLVKLLDLSSERVALVLEHRGEGEYSVHGWLSSSDLPALQPVGQRAGWGINVPPADSGFQRPMTNDHYGWQWLEWTGTVYHPGDDYNGPGGGDADCGTDIYAVANGTVRYVNVGSWGGIVVEHSWQGITVYSQYGHVSTAYVSVGQDVAKGQHIAEMGKVGADTCHLHWEIREADHPNPTYGAYWDTGVLSNYSLVNEYYEDPEWWVDNHGPYGSCSAPSLVSPPNDYVSSSRTITFQWNAPPDCSPDGYTFRVKTVPDMDYGGTTIFDEGQGGTSVTKDFASQWDNTDLYWSVRACKPCDPYNPGPWASSRHFRIEPGGPACNPNSDQAALYADTNYGGATCVTLNVGDYPDPGYLSPLGNDQAESIKVGGNVQAILYSDAGYGGRSETFTSDDPNLWDNYIGGNEVSSVKVQWRSQAPPAPTLQSPANGSYHNEGTAFTLVWNTSPGATEYYAECWGGPAGTIYSGWQTGTSWYIGSQWAGYTYSWHVKARNGAGESGWSDTWTFTVKPAAPTNLSGQSPSCHVVNLSWTDNSGNEEGTKIYRNGSYVGQVGMNVTSYQDTGLNENTTYSYYVKAFRGSIYSDASNTVNVTTPPCAPAQPDLYPCTPSGYEYPVVPSSVEGTHEVNTLYAGVMTYFDWHFTNGGDAAAPGTFYVELWVDSTRHIRYPYPDWYPDWSGGFDDWGIPVATAGWHTVKLITDADNTVAESDENNNVWQQQFYWESLCADAYELNNDPEHATSLSYGQTKSAVICPAGDLDYYEFTGLSGDAVVIDVDARVNGSLLDSYTFLYDSDGVTTLAQDDDTPCGLDSTLGYSLPHDGTFYIKVREYNHPNEGGDDYFYTLSLVKDTANPTGAITHPISGGYLDPNMETVRATASDEDGGINRVEFLWHDDDWGDPNWEWLGADYCDNGGYSWDFDTSGLPEQNGAALYIWPFDWVGHYGHGSVWNLVLDRSLEQVYLPLVVRNH